jgi:hypothetical protein
VSPTWRRDDRSRTLISHTTAPMTLPIGSLALAVRPPPPLALLVTGGRLRAAVVAGLTRGRTDCCTVALGSQLVHTVNNARH